MGQKGSSAAPCSCAADCSFKPWQNPTDTATLTTLSALNSRGGSTGGGDVDKEGYEQHDGPELFRFVVDLQKDAGDTFGLAHVPMEDGSSSLLVVDFREGGAVSRWNTAREKEGALDYMIRRGDRIVNVGSDTDMEAMRMMLRQDLVQFSVERWPANVSMRLTKAHINHKFGIQTDLIDRENGLQALCVSGIMDGILSDWNQVAYSSRRYFEIVSHGSEIIRVDGLDGPADRLQQMLKDRTDVNIVFRRPPPETYA